MTAPKFPTLTGSVAFEFFPLPQKHRWGFIEVPMASGHQEARARHSRPVREWQLTCKALSEADWDTLAGFFFEQDGGATAFYMDSNFCKVPSPHFAATTSSAAGGSRGADTVYVQYTWGDGTNETRPNTETSQAVGANEYLSVAVKTFPPGVTQANIYVGTSTTAATYVSKTTTSGGTWTEVETTVDGDSAAAQKVLAVTSTTGYAVGDVLSIDKEATGGGTEYCTVASISAGVSLTMVSDLTYTHTAVQADTVNHAWDQGDALPTSNALSEELHVRLAEPIHPALFAPDLYRLTLHLVEVI